MVDVGNLLDSSNKQNRLTFDLSCNIVFVTFGNEKFKNSRERIVNQAKSIGIFNKCLYETEDILNDTEFVRALKYKEFLRVFSLSRGFGYWMWKPYVIYKNLEKHYHKITNYYDHANWNQCINIMENGLDNIYRNGSIPLLVNGMLIEIRENISNYKNKKKPFSINEWLEIE